MTEDEIIETFKKADEFLGRYKETAKPAAEALAKLLTETIEGPWKVKGELGCYEEGADTVCLHQEEGSPDLKGEQREEAVQFWSDWSKRLAKAEVRHLFLGRHL